jgi:hypothetical protein
MTSVLYADLIPALMAALLVLVWFGVAVHRMLNDASPLVLWGTLAFAFAAATVVFFLPPSIVWLILVVQVGTSIMAYMHLRSAAAPAPAYPPRMKLDRPLNMREVGSFDNHIARD